MKLFVTILAVLAVFAANSQGASWGNSVKSAFGFGQDGKLEIADHVNVIFT